MDTNFRVIVITFFNEVETYDLYEIKTAQAIMSGWMLKAKSVFLAKMQNGEVREMLTTISNNKFQMGV